MKKRNVLENAVEVGTVHDLAGDDYDEGAPPVAPNVGPRLAEPLHELLTGVRGSGSGSRIRIGRGAAAEGGEADPPGPRRRDPDQERGGGAGPGRGGPQRDWMGGDGGRHRKGREFEERGHGRVHFGRVRDHAAEGEEDERGGRRPEPEAAVDDDDADGGRWSGKMDGLDGRGAATRGGEERASLRGCRLLLLLGVGPVSFDRLDIKTWLDRSLKSLET